VSVPLKRRAGETTSHGAKKTPCAAVNVRGRTVTLERAFKLKEKKRGGERKSKSVQTTGNFKKRVITKIIVGEEKKLRALAGYAKLRPPRCHRGKKRKRKENGGGGGTQGRAELNRQVIKNLGRDGLTEWNTRKVERAETR